MVSWPWSKFDWIEELTQIDWLKIVLINHKAFNTNVSFYEESGISIQSENFLLRREYGTSIALKRCETSRSVTDTQREWFMTDLIVL